MKENQQFKTIDLVTVVALLVSALGLTGWIMSKNFIQPDVAKAKLDAQILASQLISGGLHSLSKTSPKNRLEAERALASASKKIDVLGLQGKISHDPWGEPFHYRFVSSGKNAKTYVVVWSSGPNKRPETKDTEIHVNEAGVLVNAHFAGDDLGYTREVR